LTVVAGYRPQWACDHAGCRLRRRRAHRQGPLHGRERLGRTACAGTHAV